MPRIFSVFLAQSDRNTVLSIGEREIKGGEQSAKRVANSSELSNRTSQQNNWQSREVSGGAATILSQMKDGTQYLQLNYGGL